MLPVPMQGGRAAIAAHSFTAESGDLYGYEGGSNGPSHPGKAEPGSASGEWRHRAKYTLARVENRHVAKVNSYDSFGLGAWYLAIQP